MSGPVRAGVAGAGLMGRWHAHGVRQAGGRVAAIVDPYEAAGRRLAAAHRGSRWFPSLASALQAGSLDVVHICTPGPTHAALANLALDYGAHAMVEKPMAATAAETAALLSKAAARGLLLCPVHQFPFQRGVQRARGWLGEIGPLVHVEATFCSAGAAESPFLADEIACDILPHPMSLLQKLGIAQPDSVSWSASRCAPGEWRVRGESNGHSLAIVVSMNARPTVCRMELFGMGGTVHVNLFHGFATRESPAVSRFRKLVQPFDHSARTFLAASRNLAGRVARRQSAYPGLAELIAAFYAAARGATSAAYTAEEILAVARSRESIVDSIRGTQAACG